MANILILGSGNVSAPVIDELSDHTLFLVDKDEKAINHRLDRIATISGKSVAVTSVVGTLETGFMMHEQHISSDELFSQVDVVVSLLPPTMHTSVAKLCIAHKKHMVTSSYVSLEMELLGKEAEEQGVLLVNECGFSPGLDHMSSMQAIEKIKQEGTITSFTSYCGGLPSNSDNNPLHYQFSWSPLGVLRAAKTSALYLEQKEKKTIPDGDLCNHPFSLFIQGKTYEGYYNRNSLPYQTRYGLEEVNTFIRGTVRYQGWCKLLQALHDLHFLQEMKESLGGATYRQLLTKLIKAENLLDEQSAKVAAAAYLGLSPDHEVFDQLSWLGIFSDQKIPEGTNSPLLALNKLMIDKMGYAPKETDMVIMQQQITYTKNEKEHIYEKSLVYHASASGYRAMATTVGLPVALATKLVLAGKVSGSGLVTPLQKELYEPILAELETRGIVFEETIK